MRGYVSGSEIGMGSGTSQEELSMQPGLGVPWHGSEGGSGHGNERGVGHRNDERNFAEIERASNQLVHATGGNPVSFSKEQG